MIASALTRETHTMDDERFEPIHAYLDRLAELVATTKRSLTNAVQAELAAEVNAAWAALEKSTDPRDIELLNRIRERTRKEAESPPAA
jgi:uncharacterized membrane protein YccC